MIGNKSDKRIYYNNMQTSNFWSTQSFMALAKGYYVNWIIIRFIEIRHPIYISGYRSLAKHLQ